MLLDSLSQSPAASFSLRRVASGYAGPVARIRRGLDDSHQNVYARGSVLLCENKQKLDAWLGGSKGYVAAWYDQSGQGKHLTQANATTQPTVVNSGGVYAVRFASQTLEGPSPFSANLVSNMTFVFASTEVAVSNNTLVSLNGTYSPKTDRAILHCPHDSTRGWAWDAGDISQRVLVNNVPVGQTVVCLGYKTSNISGLQLNKGSLGSATAASTAAANVSGGIVLGQAALDHYVHEMHLFDGYAPDDASRVEGSLIGYVNNKQYLLDQLTTGAANTCTNAYSLRRLSSAYTGPVARVRREGGGCVREWPPVPLTGNVTAVANAPYGNGSYTVAASSVYSSRFTAGNAFNKNAGGWSYVAWHTTTTAVTAAAPAWVSISLPRRIVLDSFAITTGYLDGATEISRAPKQFVVQGSNDDGATWTQLAAFDGTYFTALTQTAHLPVGAKVAYRSFRLWVTATIGGAADGTHVGEWRLFERLGASLVADLKRTQQVGAGGLVAASPEERRQSAVFTADVVFPVSGAEGVLLDVGEGATGTQLGIVNGNLHFHSGNGSLAINSNGFPRDGLTHQVVADLQANPGQLRLWVDGEPVGSAATASAVQWVTEPVVTSNLALFFDTQRSGVSGNTLVDLSGNNSNGTLQGGASAVNNNYVWIDGNLQQYISTTFNPVIQNNRQYTLECWYRQTPDSPAQLDAALIANYGLTFTTRTASLFMRNAGFVRFHERNEANAAVDVIPAANLLDSKWHHIAGVANATHLAVYIDGVLQASNTRPGGNVTSGSNWFIAGRSYQRYLTGRLGATRVYLDKALTAAELQQNYNAEKWRYASADATGNARYGQSSTGSASWPGNLVSNLSVYVGNVTTSELDVFAHPQNQGTGLYVQYPAGTEVLSPLADAVGRAATNYEEPAVAMTSNQSAGYVASASSVYNSQEPYMAFDADHYVSQWQSNVAYVSGTYTGSASTLVDGQAVLGEWLQLYIPHGMRVQEYTMVPNASYLMRAPGNFRLVGSNDGTNFATIDRQYLGGLSTWLFRVQYGFRAAIVSPRYKYIRLVVESLASYTNSNAICINLLAIRFYPPNTRVTVLYDQSGNERHAAQGNLAEQPILLQSASWANGYPTVAFPGTAVLPFDCTAIANTSYTVATVLARASNRNENYYISGNNYTSGGNHNLHLGYRWPTTLTHAQWYNDYDMTIPEYTGKARTTIVNRVSTLTGRDTHQNGALLGSNVDIRPLLSCEATGIGGPPRFKRNRFHGDICEVVLFSSYLDNKDRLLLEGAQPSTTWTQAGVVRVSGPAVLDQLQSRPAAAYSLRTLRSGYRGPVVRVRRGSDNVEQDLYAVGPKLLVTPGLQKAQAWLGGAAGYVATWYDQSGNGYDAVQSNSSMQPTLLYNSSLQMFEVQGNAAAKTVLTTTYNVPSVKDWFMTCYSDGTRQNSELLGVSTGAMVDLGFGDFDSSGTINTTIRNRLRVRNVSLSANAMLQSFVLGGYYANTYLAFQVQSTGTQTRAYLPYPSPVSVTSNGAYFGWTGNLSLLGTNDTNRVFSGRATEFVLFNSPVSDADRATLHEAMGTRVGLTAFRAITPGIEASPLDFNSTSDPSGVIILFPGDSDEVRTQKLQVFYAFNSSGYDQLIANLSAAAGQLALLLLPSSTVYVGMGASVSYTIRVPQTGTYSIRARAWAPGGNSNSFYVQVDDGSIAGISLSSFTTTYSVLAAASLTAGVDHRLTLYGREPTGLLSIIVVPT